MKTEPTYYTGENMCKSDFVRLSGAEGVVELIVTEEINGWSDYWHTLGPGAMLKADAYGRVYVKFRDEDLVFLERKQL